MKLDLILENVRNKYALGLLEESEGLDEKQVLEGRMLINESTMAIREMIVEGNVLSTVRESLEEAWVEALIQESAYEDYFKAELKKCGYESIKDIPADKKDDFFKKVDAGWDAKNEG